MARLTHFFTALLALALALNPAAIALSAGDESAPLICSFDKAPLSAEAKASLAELQALLDLNDPVSAEHEQCAMSCTAYAKALFGPSSPGAFEALSMALNPMRPQGEDQVFDRAPADVKFSRAPPQAV